MFYMIKTIFQGIFNGLIGRVGKLVTHPSQEDVDSSSDTVSIPATVATLGLTTQLFLFLLLGYALYSVVTIYLLPVDMRTSSMLLDRQVMIDLISVYVGSATGATGASLITNLSRRLRVKL